ncbi:hypothetical protein FB645_000292 [Coemansia sp. IMI 203386]|nr:hypothetical protein FB645_000292 [Coemansia sp. IMI 203386]
MDSSRATPVASRNRNPAELAEAADSPLGILAAIASPSPPIKARPVSLASTLLANTNSSSTTQIDLIDSGDNGNGNVNSTKDSSALASIEPASLKTPLLTSFSPKSANGSNSESTSSPPVSPSRQAVLRKDTKGASSASNESTSSASSGTTAKAASTLSAIPATQLDVLALVTATSPPMPSRRRWALHSTQKPLSKEANSDVNTPVRIREAQEMHPNDNSHNSGSDTESEDELTLRSHSARIRSRYYDLHPRLSQLAGTSYGIRGNTMFEGTGPGQVLFASAQARRTNPSLFTAGGLADNRLSASTRVPRYTSREFRRDEQSGSRLINGYLGSDAGLSETDDEIPSNRQTPVSIRRSAQRQQGNQPMTDHDPHIQVTDDRHRRELLYAGERIPPASEPALNRRSSRRIPNGIQGSILSKQLSQLAEDDRETANSPDLQADAGQSRYSSLSVSPPPSPSQRQHRRSKKPRSNRSRMLSGSETETDTELTTRQLASGTETDQSISSRHHNGLRHTRLAPELTRPEAYPRPPSNARRVDIGVGHDSRHNQQNHHHQNKPSKRSHQGTQADSGGETTETDEEFFGHVRALHSSIRPPRRVVRQLASLRARNVQPTTLNLAAYRQPAHYSNQSGFTSPVQERYAGSQVSYQAHTAPTTGIPHEDPGPGLGLGISSAAGQQHSTQYLGAPRVLSTPSLVAGPGISRAMDNREPALNAQDCYGSNQSLHLSPSSEAQAHQQQLERRGYYRHPVPGNEGDSLNRGRTRGDISHEQQLTMSDEFTYKGAALRRLEKSHVRSSASGAGMQGTFTSRKRALTAPSTLDPPLRKRGQYGSSGRLLNSTASLLEDENEEFYTGADGQTYGRPGTTSVGGSGSNTPNSGGQGYYHQKQHGGGGQGYTLGASPMSSLRSSLVSRTEQPRNSRLYSPSSQSVDLHSTRLSFESLRSDSHVLGAEADSHDGAVSLESSKEIIAPGAGPGSPSMDAALRRTRRRHGSSGVSAVTRQSQSPSDRASSGIMHTSYHQNPSAQIRRSGHNDVAAAVTSSPRNDILFPAIDSNQG